MKLSIFTEISVFLLDKKKKKIAPRLLQALFNFQSFENVDSGHFYFSFIYLGMLRGRRDLSSLATDQTHALCSGGPES